MRLVFDPRLLTEVIGKGQYTQFRSVIAEYVANAWDAEARKVEISIPEDFSNDPIIIKDNGKGICDIKQFEKVGSNIQLKKIVTTDFSRKIMGKKGIGRFAGFACCQIITFVSNTGEEELTIKFDRDELLRHQKVEDIEIPSNTKDSNVPHGMTIKLDIINKNYSIPTVNQIIRDLLLDFGYISDFEIYVNGEKCQISEIPGKFFEVNELLPLSGHVSGNIRIANSKYFESNNCQNA